MRLQYMSSQDHEKLRRSIEIGAAGAQAASAQLATLALEPSAYRAWQQARSDTRAGHPRIDFVRVDADSERYRRALQGVFSDLASKPLLPSELDARITAYYGRGDLESLDYNWVDETDAAGAARQGILLRARRNAYGPNYVRFGLNLQDDFNGNSSFNAAARFVMTELTARGAEFAGDLQVKVC